MRDLLEAVTVVCMHSILLMLLFASVARWKMCERKYFDSPLN